MNNIERGIRIAQAIFEAPSGFKNDRTQRIAFKGGKYPDRETDLGGFNESALAECITRELDHLDALSELPKP
jgi:hypothetical protein